MRIRPLLILTLILLSGHLGGCGEVRNPGRTRLVLVGGSGAEATYAQEQLQIFMRENPGIEVSYQSTPSSATDRHTLYVTWLSARSREIDVLNIDIIWPQEFAAAGWILPLDPYLTRDDLSLNDYIEGALQASRFRGYLYSLPWYVDVGILYYRTDVLEAAGLPPPATFRDLLAASRAARAQGLPYGLIWQGAKYEGLICNALEFFWGFGGAAFDPTGTPTLNSPANIEALQFMVDLLYEHQASPVGVVTFLEEDTRHAFQQGYAGLMRNWPYAYNLMNAPDSPVRGKFDVVAMPAIGTRARVGTLGGGALAINARTRNPEAAWRLVRFLSRPDQLIGRAATLGFNPPRKSLYRDPRLVAQYPYYARLTETFSAARSRPVSPLYSSISNILQIELSRALTRQATPREALARAQQQVEALFVRYGVDQFLSPESIRARP